MFTKNQKKQEQDNRIGYRRQDKQDIIFYLAYLAGDSRSYYPVLVFCYLLILKLTTCL